MPPIMVPQHWPAAWQQTDLSDYREGFLVGRQAADWIVNTLKGPQPAAIFALADGDLAWWCYEQLLRAPGIQRHWLDCLERTSGMNRRDFEVLGEEFEQAVLAAPAWPLIYHWDMAARFTYETLLLKDASFRDGKVFFRGSAKLKLACDALYRLHEFGLFWTLLDGKRLAIISGQSEAVAAKLLDRDFVEKNGGTITWTVSAKIPCPPKPEPKAPHWPRIRDPLSHSDWNLLLCSAGTLSPLLCHHALALGRNALDIGSFDTVILGANKNNCRGFL